MHCNALQLHTYYPQQKSNERHIKTHGSELQGQERAKRIAKNNARRTNVCLLHERMFS